MNEALIYSGWIGRDRCARNTEHRLGVGGQYCCAAGGTKERHNNCHVLDLWIWIEKLRTKTREAINNPFLQTSCIHCPTISLGIGHAPPADLAATGTWIISGHRNDQHFRRTTQGKNSSSSSPEPSNVCHSTVYGFVNFSNVLQELKSLPAQAFHTRSAISLKTPLRDQTDRPQWSYFPHPIICLRICHYTCSFPLTVVSLSILDLKFQSFFLPTMHFQHPSIPSSSLSRSAWISCISVSCQLSIGRVQPLFL